VTAVARRRRDDPVVAARRNATAMDWADAGADWPHRDASRFVIAGGLRWHVQVMGQGPVLLLLHGTGASTHSWWHFAPLLARRYTVVAPDLPGHAFTEAPDAANMALPAVAAAVRRLLDALALEPVAAVGHSAGAAIAARMCLDSLLGVRALASINGAFLPFRGVQGWLLSPFARVLAATAWVPQLVAWRAADPRAVQRLVDSTGSTLDPEAVALYARLMQSPTHVAGVLAMMAAWDLAPLERDLPRLETPLALLIGDCDGTVSPAEAAVVQSRVPHAEMRSLEGCGHLAHEEAPQRVARVVLEFLQRSARR
jgi:magnesium chelatase accessory protein